MWYVYILQSRADNNLYVGLTKDLVRRFNDHNKKKVFSTKNRVPFSLIYYEAHRNKYDAAKRERFLKSGWEKNWIKRTLYNFLNLKSWEGK